jgi:large subunit ribosomal protein L23
MKLANTDIIIQPLISEKSTDLKDSNKVLCFKVHRKANKITIKKAVEEIFKTTVKDVRTTNYQGKTKRHGRYIGKRPAWKKAYVTLTDDAKPVEYFEV